MKKIISCLLVAGVLLSCWMSSAVLVSAADFTTPSTVTMPTNTHVIENFDSGLGTWSAGFAGDGTGSIMESASVCGYGTSGQGVKWTYNKATADGNSPSLRETSGNFYSISGYDGYALWVKAEAVGTIRLQVVLDDWTTSLYCDASVTAGENIVKFPFASFTNPAGKTLDSSAHAGLFNIFALTMPNSGVIYADQFVTYVADTTETFTPSTVTMPTSTHVIESFDSSLDSWSAGFAGDGTGSVVALTGACGYGTSGQGVKWTYNKATADGNSPSLRETSGNFYSISGYDGYALWVKAEAAGTVRLQVVLDDWTTSLYCDASVTAGENIVKFPFASFTNPAGKTLDSSAHAGLFNIFALTMPNSGVIYADQFVTYVADTTETFTPSTVTMPDNSTVINNFDGNLGSWIAGFAGDGTGSVVALTGACGYGTSGQSVKWTYNKEKADGNSPSLRETSGTFYNKAGNDGIAFWLKTEATGTIRIQGVLDDWSTSLYYDVQVVAGENIVKIPFADLKNITGSSTTWGSCTGFGAINIFALTMPDSGVMYFDQFATYSTQSSGGGTGEDPEGSYTPSTVAMPTNSTGVDSFDNSLGSWSAGFAGDGTGSIVALSKAYGYGTSGQSLKWTYNKQKADGNSPSIRNTSESFYSKVDKGGIVFWLKTAAAGTIRVQGLLDDWTTSLYCDVTVTAGENIVKVPYADFKSLTGASNPWGSCTGIGFINIFALTMPDSGVMYFDQFSVYDDSKQGTDYEIIGLDSQYDYQVVDDLESYTTDDDLSAIWIKRNEGENKLGAVIGLNTDATNSYSGKSIQFHYNMKESNFYSPAVTKLKPDYFDWEGDGFCFWLKNTESISFRVGMMVDEYQAVMDFKDIPAGEHFYYVSWKDLTYLLGQQEVAYDDLGFEPSDCCNLTFYYYPSVSQYRGFETTIYMDQFSYFSAKESTDNSSSSTDDKTSSADNNGTVSKGSNSGSTNSNAAIPNTGYASAAAAVLLLGTGAATTMVVTRKKKNK